MLGRAASCCDLLRLSPTPGDSSEDDVSFLYYICIYTRRTPILFVSFFSTSEQYANDLSKGILKMMKSFVK